MVRFLRIGVLLSVGLGTGLFWQFSQSAMPKSKPVKSAPPKRGPRLTTQARFLHEEKLPARTDRQTIRVNITPANSEKVRIAIDGPFAIRNMTTNRSLGRFAGMKQAEAVAGRRLLQIGSRTFRTTDLEIVPESSPSIWVGRHQYRGTVRLHRKDDGRLLAINVVSMYYYLASVVDGEMPAKFPDEARKAQAVVARTYARFRMSETRGFGLFDVYADSRGQRYLGYQYRATNDRRLAGESKASRQLVRDTVGLVCRENGKLFSPYYSAVCGGATTPGKGVFGDAGPALKSVPCQWCRHAKRYRWKKTIGSSQFEAAVRKILKSRQRSFGELRFVHSVPGKRETFEVADRVRRHRISGKELRRALQLPSPRFAVLSDRRGYTLTGRGHGHGVGLCQHGAAGQAKAGRSFQEILRYYYSGVELARVK